MFSICISEMIKTRRNATIKLIIVAPMLALILGTLFANNTVLGHGASFFWFIHLLPITITICTSSLVNSEKRLKYLNVLATRYYPWKIMCCKMIIAVGIMILGCISYRVLSLLGSRFIFSWSDIDMQTSVWVLLSLSMLWRIPVVLFLSVKIGIFALLAMDLPLTIVSGLMADRINVFPFSLPGKILLSEGHSYWSYIPLSRRPSLPLIEAGLAFLLFGAISVLIMGYFNRMEIT